MDDADPNQGLPEATRSCKRKQGSLLDISEVAKPYQHLEFGLRASDLGDNTFLLLSAANVVVGICCLSPRKLRQDLGFVFRCSPSFRMPSGSVVTQRTTGHMSFPTTRCQCCQGTKGDRHGLPPTLGSESSTEPRRLEPLSPW